VFRLTYNGLEEPVAVTRDGRVAGFYIPVSAGIDERWLAGLRPGEPGSGSSSPAGASALRDQVATDASRDPSAHPGPSVPGAPMTQAERDRVLRKVRTK